MSGGHVRRTNTPAPRSAFGGAKRLWLASVILPFAALTPFVTQVVFPPEHDEIDQIIRQAGFSPLPSPSRLRGPGALYKVEDGDDNYEKVCKEPALTAEMIQTSPSLDRNLQKLEKAGFSLVGDIVDTLNAKLSGTRVTSIQYKLTNVAISEISGDDLLVLQEKMFEDKHCRDTVDRHLKDKKRICPVSSAISATTSYKVHINQEFETDADRKDKASVVKVVQKTIEEKTRGQIQILSDDELVGENLFLGIRLYSLCVTPDDATEPIAAPLVLPKDKTAALP